MQATLKISVRTAETPIYIFLSFNDRDIWNYSTAKGFKHKINSFTLYHDFLMTGLEFKVKKNKIKYLDDFYLELVFTLDIEMSKDRLKALEKLYSEIHEIDEDSADELYKWIRKVLSELRKNAIYL